MNALTGLVIFAGVALIGWGIAELKGRFVGYTRNEAEVKAEEASLSQRNPELGIKDVVGSISTKGFSAN